MNIRNIITKAAREAGRRAAARIKGALPLIIGLALALGITAAQADTNWLGGNGNWDPGNWSNGLPGFVTGATAIDGGVTVTIQSGVNAAAQWLALSGEATLVVEAGASLTLTNAFANVGMGMTNGAGQGHLVVNGGSVTALDIFFTDPWGTAGEGGSLTVNGGSVVVNNIYSRNAATATVNLNGGVLQVNNGLNFNPSVGVGAKLDIVFGLTSKTETGKLDTLAASLINNVTFTFNLTGLSLNTGAIEAFDFQIVTGAALGNFDLGENDFTLKMADGWQMVESSFNYNQATGKVSFELEYIPEPSTWALMLGGLGALALLRRRRA